MRTAVNQNQPGVARRGWQERLRAMGNLPPVTKIVWESAPKIVLSGLGTRVVTALVPVAMLAVTRLIVGLIVAFTPHPRPLSGRFCGGSCWCGGGLKCGRAGLGMLWARDTYYFDCLLAKKFPRHVSTRIMEHASRMDLAAYEDPVFYDKMERARVQSTDRIGMIQATGRLVQQVITTASLALRILNFSPWPPPRFMACSL